MMKKELRPTTKRWIVREQVGLTNKTKGAYAKACVCAEVGYDAGAQRQRAKEKIKDKRQKYKGKSEKDEG